MLEIKSPISLLTPFLRSCSFSAKRFSASSFNTLLVFLILSLTSFLVINPLHAIKIHVAPSHSDAFVVSRLKNAFKSAVNKYNQCRPHHGLKGLTPMQYINNSDIEAVV